jgi:hypothetical protein
MLFSELQFVNVSSHSYLISVLRSSAFLTNKLAGIQFCYSYLHECVGLRATRDRLTLTINT